MSDTYRDVDGSSAPLQAVEWQVRVNAFPAVRDYKRYSLEALRGADRVLDVGCGPGTELSVLGPAAVGVDRAKTMCRAARVRAGIVACADGARLPFPDGAFEGARADRVIQHVDEPAGVIGELVRVVDAGGVVVLADPDQETLGIHVPGATDVMITKVEALRRDTGIRNGRVASTYPEVLRRMGLEEVRLAAFPLTIIDPSDAMGVAEWPRLWRDRGVGVWTDHEVEQWETALRPGAPAGFLFTVTYLVASGVVSDGSSFY